MWPFTKQIPSQPPTVEPAKFKKGSRVWFPAPQNAQHQNGNIVQLDRMNYYPSEYITGVIVELPEREIPYFSRHSKEWYAPIQHYLVSVIPITSNVVLMRKESDLIPVTS